jgi:ribosomal protein S18 acetylase RimI-like enzyme
VRSVVRPDQPPGPAVRILRGGGLVARVRPWPGDATIAHLVTLDQQACPSSAVLRSWMRHVAEDGYHRVRTGAVLPAHRPAYDALGFSVVQDLALLHLDLRLKISRPPHRASERSIRIRHMRADELTELACVDQAAFPAGWGLDELAITEAADATSSNRVRVVVAGSTGPILAFAISGRSGTAAFLQRLAVRPDSQRSGLGAALVHDGATWARRWRARTMSVNTQHDNLPALSLYRRAGFVDAMHRLVVMECALEAHA